MFHHNGGGGLHLIDQLVADFKDFFSRQRRRLLYEINRAGIQRGQRHLAAVTGDADNDDGQRLARHLFAYETDAIHSRHNQIARHHVGRELLGQLQRLCAVARRADHIDERAAQEHLLDHLAHVGRIVYH